MKKGLDAISKRTLKLWYAVNEKYGSHVYTLAVNGLDEVILSKAYTEDIAKGNRNVERSSPRSSLFTLFPRQMGRPTMVPGTT